MNTIWTAAMAWIGWNVVGPLVLVAAVALVAALYSIPAAIRRARCHHLRFRETMSCDAVCLDCGKNLGFVDNARARQRATLEG